MTAPLPLLTESEIRNLVADGVECGYGCLRTERGTLPLRQMDVEARVIATFAHTTLRQVFVNTLGVPLEATYIFPLPDRAAVTRFTMEVAGRRVEGELQERRQARQTYDVAIAQGKRASIAEEERPGVFTIRVGNLMPGEAAAITIEMSGALPVADGEVTYRFPLVVAPRYMPGQALGGENVGDGSAADTDAVPDASRISPPVLLPGMQSPVRLSMAVELDGAGLPLSMVRSSLHAAYADERMGRLVVRTTPGEKLNRDFILRFKVGDAAVHTSARLLRGTPDGDTFAVTLLPPTLNIQHKPKDVVFVIDRSGSMQGWKMVAARRATARMIDSLRAHDRFSVIAFDDNIEEFQTGLLEATDRNRFRASEWLGKVDARGGTEMAPPLARAADLLSGGFLERDRVLVFVTDGQVGNEAQLMKLLGQRLKGARVFPLGIDQAVNAGFMNRLASIGRAGEAELIESEDRLDEVLARLHRRVDAPAIAELSLDVQGGSLVGGTLAPAQLPDVFAGIPTTIFGKVYTGVGGGLMGRVTFVVRGRMADGKHFEQHIGADEVTNPAVRTAWARLHLRDLEDRFDAGQGNKADLERKIVDVSLRHTVLCRFTAFVAVDHEVVNRGGWQHKATQAVEPAAGWGMLGTDNDDAEGGSFKGGPAPGAAASAAGVGGMRSSAHEKSKSVAMPSKRAKAQSEAYDEAPADALFDGAPERSISVGRNAPAPSAAPSPPPAPKPAMADLMRAESKPMAAKVPAQAQAVSSPSPVRAPEPMEKEMEEMDAKSVKLDQGDAFGSADFARKAEVSGETAASGAAAPATPPPASTATPTRRGGFLGGLFGGGKAKDKAPSSSSPLWAPFAARLQDLVDLCRRKSQDLFGIAREIEQRLRLVLEDMAHAGIAADERRVLDEANRAIKDAVLSGDSLNVERALERAEDLLARAVAHAGGASSSSSSSSSSGPPPSSKREGFWR